MSIRDQYYTKAELADELGVTPRTLDRWWAERTGPPRTKLGKTPLYRKEIVAKWALSKEAAAVRDSSEAA